ncbi:YCII-related domain-containing protein [Hirsutella rhossiliensis]|uniref:YCII-related domain-containing protein n=1 Tax=Hirsutella rhossiliensis TaxID=111463 RepID=A0A9P8N8H0_9HYPO|nr:YCII-related domain-containing protein [Hirsutella rhossiliensis]KAH0967916.1 YCII-related domain-containing protein [Hirsutella rhossiliensis]
MLSIQSDPVYAEARKQEPPTDHLESLASFSEEMAEAGVLLVAEGFKPTADGYRIKYSSAPPHEVVTGPFDVAKENHVCGVWLIETNTPEEALAWAKKVPFVNDGEVVMRRVGYGHEENSTFTKELKSRTDKLRAQMEKNRKAVGM